PAAYMLSAGQYDFSSGTTTVVSAPTWLIRASKVICVSSFSHSLLPPSLDIRFGDWYTQITEASPLKKIHFEALLRIRR
ncbi:MAG: hypothetical protein M3437_11200, partial [Chloroflexota bacterium]|nr:hypothetical protein [Chloroflexota bacterium]MDQ5866479.1 hypothetical protein [Chloroflexota bacterium]